MSQDGASSGAPAGRTGWSRLSVDLLLGFLAMAVALGATAIALRGKFFEGDSFAALFSLPLSGALVGLVVLARSDLPFGRSAGRAAMAWLGAIIGWACAGVAVAISDGQPAEIPAAAGYGAVLGGFYTIIGAAAGLLIRRVAASIRRRSAD